MNLDSIRTRAKRLESAAKSGECPRCEKMRIALSALTDNELRTLRDYAAGKTQVLSLELMPEVLELFDSIGDTPSLPGCPGCQERGRESMAGLEERMKAQKERKP
jgi:hypothetical protein